MLNEDYKEMLQILLDNKIKFLVVGAYAMGVYGYPRATGDIDFWVLASAENSKKIFESLKQFGAPLQQINKETFAEKGVVFQIGVAPRRIDIITKIDGVDFDKAYENRQEIAIENMNVPIISIKDLIKNKESTSREKDALDVKELRRINK
ncbi:MAG: nucleotidyltransferase [Planctomycetes bacterium]|nr:nucleotidyltransferase [Planctomycetota bacterium]MCK5473048.1 nucleotidyltransferase [Planctomycetota bacterium]